MLLDRGSCCQVGATACDVKPAAVCKTLHDNARCLPNETDKLHQELPCMTSFPIFSNAYTICIGLLKELAQLLALVHLLV